MKRLKVLALLAAVTCADLPKIESRFNKMYPICYDHRIEVLKVAERNRAKQPGEALEPAPSAPAGCSCDDDVAPMISEIEGLQKAQCKEEEATGLDGLLDIVKNFPCQTS